MNYPEYVDYSAIEMLVRQLADLLGAQGLTLSVAESCTGGLLAKLLTDIPGSSEWFKAGIVAYSNDAKQRFLDVPTNLIDEYGAVSQEVAMAMAEGVKLATGSSISIAVTGIAGPGGGTTEKPVGTVYIALADQTGCRSKMIHLSGCRNSIRMNTAETAFNWIFNQLSSRPECSDGDAE